MLDGPYPHEDREITLTTTWSGTATNPFTGETQTINGLVTTTETTGKFPLSHLVINNTDTWEEKTRPLTPAARANVTAAHATLETGKAKEHTP